ncbi:MAG: hypothetical protein QM605_14365 [Sphingobium sp.]
MSSLLKAALLSTVWITISAAPPSLAAGSSPPELTITLTPIPQQGDVRTIEVVQTIKGYDARPGKSAFEVPSRIALTKGQNYQQGDVTASDNAGPLSLTLTNAPSPPGLPLDLQSFTPARPISGPVTLRYRATIVPAMTARRPGPSYDLRGVNGGFGGAFFSFLLIPSGVAGPMTVDLKWDFSRAAPGSRGATTKGPGDLHFKATAEDLNVVFLLGGKISQYTPADSKFSSYWIGTPSFDAQRLSDWAARSFNTLQTFFRDAQSPAFTLLMRPYANPRDGGAATRGGFMLEYGVGQLSDSAREAMFTHEMVHHFVGSLDGDSGANAWFGEGLAEFFKVRLPYRAKLLDLAAATHEFDVMTEAYYTGALVATPYEEVGQMRWAAAAAQYVPYNRGFMYFVNLNAKIVAHSSGRRSLDDLVLAMLARRRAGQTYDEAAWRELLRAELGDAGPADLDAMLAGKLMVPPDDAFGQCFHRVTIPHAHRPVLGFDEIALLAEPHLVTGLDDGSAASTAGLRDGDKILAYTGIAERIAHSASNVKLSPTVELTVQRGGTTSHIRFSTVGPEITQYRWVPKIGYAGICDVP